jgi:hypothetical protein
VGITFSRLSLSYWIDNLGFITEGKLAAIFIKTFSWGFPTGRSFLLNQLGPITHQCMGGVTGVLSAHQGTGDSINCDCAASAGDPHATGRPRRLGLWLSDPRGGDFFLTLVMGIGRSRRQFGLGKGRVG